MTKDEALKLALEALEHEADKGNDDAYKLERDAIKEALAQPEQEQFALKHRIAELEGAVIGLQTQRTWVGLIRGVRVEVDTVVITVKGGNDAARELCGELIKEMEINK